MKYIKSDASLPLWDSTPRSSLVKRKRAEDPELEGDFSEQVIISNPCDKENDIEIDAGSKANELSLELNAKKKCVKKKPTEAMGEDQPKRNNKNYKNYITDMMRGFYSFWLKKKRSKSTFRILSWPA